MGLIVVDRHRPADLEAWARLERLDQIRASTDRRWPRREQQAKDAIREFGAAYLGVSWGKDSVVVAHLAVSAETGIPMVWINERPVANPHCALVRDAFLARFPGTAYHEIEAWCEPNGAGGWHASGSIERGFAEAVRRFGDRHISGIRAEESGRRQARMRTWGVESPNTLAPIGWWTADDVFAYLRRHDLPVHPVYAMSHGGLLDRGRLRVASLGRRHGTGHGRRDWELDYYGPEMAEIGEGPRVPW